MFESHSELETPILLLAMPQVLDPFFHRSVVLLIHHEEEGSLGFILNRPTTIRVTEILQGMEITWKGDQAALAYFGGPVQPQLGTVLYSYSLASNGRAADEAEKEILPGLSITQHVGDLADLADKPPDAFRLFLGYAGWGAGQLIEEILRNDWLTAPVNVDLIFAPRPEGVWGAALASVGVDPASLPSWTPAGGTDNTN